MRAVLRLLAVLSLGSGGSLAGLVLDPTTARADTSIHVVAASPLPGGLTCGVALFCYSPARAVAVAGVPIRWTNTTGLAQSATSDDNGATFDTGQIPPQGISAPVVLQPGTYTYHDGLQLTTTGTLVVVLPGQEAAALPAGLAPGSISGAGTGPPHIVAATPPPPTVAAPVVGPPGSHALPPLTAGAPPDEAGSQALPPITPTSPEAPPHVNTPRLAASAAADTGGGGPTPAIGGLLLLVIAGAGGSCYGLSWWRKRERAATGGRPGAV